MPRSCPVNYPGWQERRAILNAVVNRPLVRGEVRLGLLDVLRVDRARARYGTAMREAA